MLAVGVPMVFSMLSHSLMQFTDRIFLGNYSLEALAACLPASVTAFLFLSFFMGVGEYVSVFVAQYTGSIRHHRVGAAVWQGLWFCVPASLTLAALSFAGEPLFTLGGHAPELIRLEKVYFHILCLGGGFAIVDVVLSSFYSGQGRTMAVAVVNGLGAAVNIPLDYALINGWWIFPEMGIVGAGVATVFGSAFIAVVFVILIFTKDNDRMFAVRRAWRPDRDLFSRFMKYGLPGGAQFFVDMFAITFFIFMMGRLGTAELAATNMVISLDLLVFLPCVGLSFAASVLVGQAIGAGAPEIGERSTGNAMRLATVYALVMSLSFILFGKWLLHLFLSSDLEPARSVEILGIGRNMLYFVSAYLLLDGAALVYMGALKGAGDSAFVMRLILAASISMLVVPVYLITNHTDIGYIGPWACLTVYVVVLTGMSYLRFRGGRWKSMQVIEKEPVTESS